ncbi:MAG: acyl-CoA dehydrogenase [Gammaproteobacteria bacterium]|nr:MAG: acyl-CoA dehydrogenase [Gammaproteobacteria bacterium]
MSSYAAPIRDMEFVLNELAGLGAVTQLPGYEQATPDVVGAILEESAKFAAEVLAPLNQVGDRERSELVDDAVRLPDGWKDAYRMFIENGWNGLALDERYGGQGLPWLVATAVQEMWHAANMSFALCPMLTQAAVEAILRHGSDEQKQTYLAKLTAGTWAGTMNLTEPQAGSDLSAVRAKAVPEDDHYLISGQKIFITYGDHDLTENIVHLVLARTPDAPAGVKGISMFIVPKYLVRDDGSLGERNDVRTVSLEHKLGIHASPTAVLAYGDRGGAVGYLLGEENRGLEYMFTMMNLARLVVGVEGVAIAERAYQQARDYARERVQGRPLGAEQGGGATIIAHPDVRRMLMTMKAQIEAMRAVACIATAAFDKALRHPDADERRRQHQLMDLLTPVVKGWCTELGVEIASTGVQIHGGMGYIEETGASQHLRDARITTIYEGTTGIQASDLVGRKIVRDRGQGVKRLIETMQSFAAELDGKQDDVIESIRTALVEGIDALSRATDWILAAHERDPRLPAAASVPYLRLLGTVVGGWQMARAALVARRRLRAGEGDASFYQAKLITARFYAGHIMPQARALLHVILQGSEATLALDTDQF